jgi:tetratricopeptide (TPR) repeat protein
VTDTSFAAFLHGRPADLVASLARCTDPADRWVLGAALGALGRFGESLALLKEVAAAEPPLRYASLARSTAASHYRQLGRHDDAHRLDTAALRHAEDDRTALFDARLGLAADAVGAADAATARAHLDQAREHADGWRATVRLGWVETEIALLTGDAGAAVAFARPALAAARTAQAPRHIAKCLLFLGVSEHVAAQRGAVTTLADASLAAGRLRALPLRWVAETVLAELPGVDPRPHRAAAAHAIRGIAGHLEGRDRTRWVERPNIKSLLATSA